MRMSSKHAHPTHHSTYIFFSRLNLAGMTLPRPFQTSQLTWNPAIVKSIELDFILMIRRPWVGLRPDTLYRSLWPGGFEIIVHLQLAFIPHNMNKLIYQRFHDLGSPAGKPALWFLQRAVFCGWWKDLQPLVPLGKAVSNRTKCE